MPLILAGGGISDENRGFVFWRDDSRHFMRKFRGCCPLALAAGSLRAEKRIDYHSFVRSGPRSIFQDVPRTGGVGNPSHGAPGVNRGSSRPMTEAALRDHPGNA